MKKTAKAKGPALVSKPDPIDAGILANLGETDKHYLRICRQILDGRCVEAQTSEGQISFLSDPFVNFFHRLLTAIQLNPAITPARIEYLLEGFKDDFALDLAEARRMVALYGMSEGKKQEAA